MGDAPKLREEYATRYAANAALLAIVCALAWLWFTAHVKPHISTLLFSGVSLAGLVGVALAVLPLLFDKVKAIDFLRKLLEWKWATPVLVALPPLIAFAFLTTFTLDLTAANDAGNVRLNVRNGTSSTPVVLSALEKQKAVSYFFAFRPVTARVETLSPVGFDAGDVHLQRGIPTELAVPNRDWQTKFCLVRLIPLYNLFQLRGRREPDMRYLVRVYVPHQPQPIERAGLSFKAIYLGASLENLQAQSKTDQAATTELRSTLNAIDGGLTEKDVDGIIADWLGEPEFIPTPKLEPGDKVRIVLRSPAGSSETTVTVAGPLRDVFLKGAAE